MKKLIAVSLIILSSICFSQEKAKSPNILLLITDDQRYDDLQKYMPYTYEKIFNQGVKFNKAYITTPACCPSRASIFTGKYASSHEVKANRYRLFKNTMFQYLAKKDLYYQGLIGKYINTWNGEKRNEFDFWVSFRAGSSRYNDPRLNVNGVWSKHQGYITDILGSYAIDFLDKSEKQTKPFFLTIPFNAPHQTATPAQRHLSSLKSDIITDNPNFNEVDRSDKPLWLRSKKSMSKKRIARNKEFRANQRKTLLAVDESIEMIINKIKDQGKLDNTVIIFLSDNGLLLGEHGLVSKDSVYEAAIKVPFAIKIPGIASQERNEVVSNIDIAPTIYELVGLNDSEITEGYDGSSMLRLFDRNIEWRKSLMIEGFRSKGPRLPFAAVHTGRYVYVQNERIPGKFDINNQEFYDLSIDPYQLQNYIHNDVYQNIINSLRADLNSKLLKHRGSTSFRAPVGDLQMGDNFLKEENSYE